MKRYEYIGVFFDPNYDITTIGNALGMWMYHNHKKIVFLTKYTPFIFGEEYTQFVHPFHVDSKQCKLLSRICNTDTFTWNSDGRDSEETDWKNAIKFVNNNGKRSVVIFIGNIDDKIKKYYDYARDLHVNMILLDYNGKIIKKYHSNNFKNYIRESLISIINKLEIKLKNY